MKHKLFLLRKNRRFAPRCRPDPNTYDPAAVLAVEAKDIIDRNFADRSVLKEKLNALGIITRGHLSKLFEKSFEMSPEQYIAQIRFQRAKELLDAGYRATDTAFEVGLGSSSAFTAFFKKQAGISPREYVSRQASAHPFCFYKTPAGVIRIEENNLGITSLRFVDDKTKTALPSGNGVYPEDAISQIPEYFAQKRKVFDIPLSVTGSEFQKKVQSALRNIPYGETRSYRQIAEEIGNKNAARAVGMANNRNPVLIMIPCHRGVGKNGELTGYAGGLDRKQFLLKMEAI